MSFERILSETYEKAIKKVEELIDNITLRLTNTLNSEKNKILEKYKNELKRLKDEILG